MRKIATAFAFLVLTVLSDPAQARPWQGITPGSSTRAEVVKRFGQPYREIKQHGRCAELFNYQAGNAIKGSKQANFCLDAAGVVTEISVFPSRSLSKELVAEAYGADFQKRLTDEFREYFLYKNQGLAVFFEADGESVHSIVFSAPTK